MLAGNMVDNAICEHVDMVDIKIIMLSEIYLFNP